MAKQFLEQYDKSGNKTGNEDGLLFIESIQTPKGVPLGASSRYTEIIDDANQINLNLGALADENSINSEDLIANNAVTQYKIKSGAIGSDALAMASITADILNVSGVTSNYLATGFIDRDDLPELNYSAIASGVLTQDDFDADIPVAKIKDSTLTSAKIAANCVTSAMVTDGTITGLYTTLLDYDCLGTTGADTTVSNPTSITVNAKGLITAVS